MVHCFTENIIGENVTITGEDVNHIRNVMRMKPGDEILVSDGAGTNVICRLVSLTESEVTAEVLRSADSRELPVQITLIQALPKGDKMETIIQKGTELGVTRFIPIESTHCVVKLDDKGKNRKVERWQKIAQSAAEQSQRSVVPEVMPVMRYADAVKMFGNAGEMPTGCNADNNRREGTTAEGSENGCISVFAYECASDGSSLKTLLEACRNRRTAIPGTLLREIRIFIGPEGGWSEEEAELAKTAGIPWITLGRRILRTETAGIALAAAVMLEIEAGNS